MIQWIGNIFEIFDCPSHDILLFESLAEIIQKKETIPVGWVPPVSVATTRCQYQGFLSGWGCTFHGMYLAYPSPRKGLGPDIPTAWKDLGPGIPTLKNGPGTKNLQGLTNTIALKVSRGHVIGVQARVPHRRDLGLGIPPKGPATRLTPPVNRHTLVKTLPSRNLVGKWKKCPERT